MEDKFKQETKDQKATLAELIYRSQNGEKIELKIYSDKTFCELEWALDAEPRFTSADFGKQYEYRIIPKTVTITREQLAEAWDNSAILKDGAEKSVMFQTLCKELGL